MSSSDDDVLHFVAASFPSVWALELLLALKRDRHVWTHEELVVALRASDLVVAKAVHALVSAGLASVEGDGARFAPANSKIEECIERVEQLYRARPNAVRRTIIAAGTSSAAAFADAFKIRREKDD